MNYRGETMEKLPREKIIEKANEIFNTCDVVAKHGTSLKNAVSIMDTGFRFDKTSMAGQISKDPVKLCSYGWKENPAGDSTNVIIVLPKSFIKMLKGYNDEEYEQWLERYVKDGTDSTMLFYGVADVIPGESTEFMGIPLPGIDKYCVPREFVKGFFFFCDNTTYLNFVHDPSEALEHLSYVENEHYFENLSPVEQQAFVEELIAKKEKKTQEQPAR